MRNRTNDIKKFLKKVGCENRGRIALAEDMVRFRGFSDGGNESFKEGKFLD
jgi:hypothetical protein